MTRSWGTEFRKYFTPGLMVISLMMGACSRDVVQRKDHQVAQDPDPTSGLKRLKTATEAEFLALSKDQFSKMTLPEALEKRSSEELDSQVISVLERFLLNEKFLEDHGMRNRDRLIWFFEYFNRTLIHMLESEWANSNRVKEVLEKYESIVLAYCSDDLRGCKYHRFIGVDSDSAIILTRIAIRKDQILKEGFPSRCESETCSTENDKKYLSELDRYYKILQIAFEFKGFKKSSELDFLFLKRAKEYNYRYLDILAKKRKKTADELTDTEIASSQKINYLGNIFENIIDYYEVKDADSDEFREFVNNFNPWNFSRKRSSPLQRGIEKMFSYASEFFLYGEDGNVSDALIESIRKSQEEPIDGKISHLQKYNKLAEVNPQLLFNFRLEKEKYIIDEMYNEYFFVFDRIFAGHIRTTDAMQILRFSKKDPEKMAEAYIRYIRLELLYLLQHSNEELKKIFQNNKSSSETAFKAILDQSSHISDQWQRLLLSMNDAFMFTEQSIPIFSRGFKKFEEMSDINNNIKKNIKYFAVYPNMIVLSYFLSLHEGNIQHEVWWGTITINPKEVMDYLISGAITPWLRWGNDNEKLEKGQMILAFTYGLLAQNFETFSFINKATGKPSIDPFMYFEKLFEFTLDPTRLKIVELNKEIVAEFEGNLTFYDGFLRYCENPETFEATVDMSKLHEFTYLGAYDMSSSSYIASALKLYLKMGDSKWNEYTNTLTVRLRFLETLIKNYRSQLELQENAGMKVDKDVLQKIEREFKKVVDERKKFISKFYSLHKRITRCLPKALRDERRIRMAQIRGEINYFKKVWWAFSEVHSENSELPETEKTRLVLEKLESHYENVFAHEGRQAVGYPNYYISKYGIFERLRHRISKELRSDSKYQLDFGEVEMELPKIKVSTPIHMKEADFYEAIPESIQFDPNESQMEFVKKAMTKYGLSGSAIIKYISAFVDVSVVKYIERDLLQLLKFGEIEILEQDQVQIDGEGICQKDGDDPSSPCLARISLDEFVQTVATYRKFISFWPEEKDIYSLLGEKEWIKPEKLMGYLLDKETLDPLPLMQYSYRRLFNDYNDKDLIDTAGNVSEVGKIGSALSNSGFLVFKPKRYVCENIYSSYSPALTKYKENVESFSGFFEGNDRKISDKWANELGQVSVELKFEPSSSGDSSSVELIPLKSAWNNEYIRHTDLEEYEGRMKQFEIDSSGYYKDQKHLKICTEN